MGQEFELHTREFRLRTDRTSARIVYNEGSEYLREAPAVAVHIPCILDPKGELVEVRLADILREGEGWREVAIRLLRGLAQGMAYTHGLEHVDYRRVGDLLGKLTNDELIERKTAKLRE